MGVKNKTVQRSTAVCSQLYIKDGRCVLNIDSSIFVHNKQATSKSGFLPMK